MMGWFRRREIGIVTLKEAFARREALVAAIVMRMRWQKTNDDHYAVVPFAFLHAHQANDCFWIIVGFEDREPVVIKDDIALFPSDQLVTQLRILEGK